MVAGVLTPVGQRWNALPVWARIVVLYLLARIVTTMFFVLAAELSGPASRFGADASISSFVLGWDAQWYWLVAYSGYPTELPLTESGQVAENAWAFMPVYAYLANIVGLPLGSWGAGAFFVSFVAGYFACIALYRLLEDRVGEDAALWAVALFASGPLAALFQVGYAETLFLLFLLLALNAVAKRRFVPLYLIIPLMAFTRPGVLAFALYLGLYGVMRWIKRATDPLPRRDIVHIVALGALATVCGFAWQGIAALVTGRADAYLATELSWRRNWIAESADGFLPFDGWVQASGFWFSLWGLPSWWGPVALAVLVLGLAMLLISRPVHKLGTDIQLWSVSYLLYLLAVFFPQSSTFRLLLPLTPLVGALAVSRRILVRTAVLSLSLIGQWAWIFFVYAQGSAFWQVP